MLFWRTSLIQGRRKPGKKHTTERKWCRLPRSKRRAQAAHCITCEPNATPNNPHGSTSGINCQVRASQHRRRQDLCDRVLLAHWCADGATTSADLPGQQCLHERHVEDTLPELRRLDPALHTHFGNVCTRGCRVGHILRRCRPVLVSHSTHSLCRWPNGLQAGFVHIQMTNMDLQLHSAVFMGVVGLTLNLYRRASRHM